MTNHSPDNHDSRRKRGQTIIVYSGYHGCWWVRETTLRTRGNKVGARTAGTAAIRPPHLAVPRARG
eukprot:149884-Pyramimonas_sp.AAC.1